MPILDSGRRASLNTGPWGALIPCRRAACGTRSYTASSAGRIGGLPWTVIVILSAAPIWSGCGSVGEPLPPLLNIPERVQDLAAKQIEKSLAIEWTWPLLTTEGARLEDVEKFVVYGMPIADPAQPPSPEAFEPQAAEWRELTAPEIKSYGPGEKIELSIPAAEHIGRAYALTVRAESRRGRRGGLSNIHVIELVEPPATPAVLNASLVPESVTLTWPAAERATAYRVYRQSPPNEEFQPLGETATTQFHDAAIQWDQTYKYRVRPLAQTSAGVTEGADSPTVEIITTDTFPPAPPADLRAVVTPTSVELSWRGSTEADFAGYRIRRQSGNTPPAALNENLTATPSFSDRGIQSGNTYRYTVTALDQNGNESAASEPIEAVIP